MSCKQWLTLVGRYIKIIVPKTNHLSGCRPIRAQRTVIAWTQVSQTWEKYVKMLFKLKPALQSKRHDRSALATRPLLPAPSRNEEFSAL